MKNDVYKPAPEPVWSFDDLGSKFLSAVTATAILAIGSYATGVATLIGG